MSSAPILEPYQSIDTNFDLPQFSLDNTFKHTVDYFFPLWAQPMGYFLPLWVHSFDCSIMLYVCRNYCVASSENYYTPHPVPLYQGIQSMDYNSPLWVFPIYRCQIDQQLILDDSVSAPWIILQQRRVYPVGPKWVHHVECYAPPSASPVIKQIILGHYVSNMWTILHHYRSTL